VTIDAEVEIDPPLHCGELMREEDGEKKWRHAINVGSEADVTVVQGGHGNQKPMPHHPKAMDAST
jgi:hypothetical protein